MADGFIYCLSNASMPGLLKVGMTTRTVEERAKELFTTGLATPFTIEFAKHVTNPMQIEKCIHKTLEKYAVRVTKRREFFKVSLKEVRDLFDIVEGTYTITNATESVSATASAAATTTISTTASATTSVVTPIAAAVAARVTPVIAPVLPSTKCSSCNGVGLISLSEDDHIYCPKCHVEDTTPVIDISPISALPLPSDPTYWDCIIKTVKSKLIRWLKAGCFKEIANLKYVSPDIFVSGVYMDYPLCIELNKGTTYINNFNIASIKNKTKKDYYSKLTHPTCEDCIRIGDIPNCVLDIAIGTDYIVLAGFIIKYDTIDRTIFYRSLMDKIGTCKFNLYEVNAEWFLKNTACPESMSAFATKIFGYF